MDSIPRRGVGRPKKGTETTIMAAVRMPTSTKALLKKICTLENKLETDVLLTAFKLYVDTYYPEAL